MHLLKFYLSGLFVLLYICSGYGQEEVKLLLQEPLEFRYNAFGKKWGSSGNTSNEIVACSPDGKWLATGDNVIWDMASKLQVKQLPKMPTLLENLNVPVTEKSVRYTIECLKMVFVPGSNLLAGVWNIRFDDNRKTSLMLWDWKNDQLLKEVIMDDYYLDDEDISLTCSRDGSKILLGAHDPGNRPCFQVWVWSIPDWKLLFQKKHIGNEHPYYGLRHTRLRFKISPDNSRIAIGLIPASNRAITYKDEVVPTFIEIWNLSSGKKEKTFTPQNEWTDYRLLDYAFSSSGAHLYAVFMQDDVKADSLFYHAVRWHVPSGGLAPKEGLGDFYAKMKLNEDQGHYKFNYEEIRHLSEDGQYFYTPYEGVLDLHTSMPAGNLFSLANNNYDQYPIEGVVVPGTPTTMINLDRNNTVPYLIDLVTGRQEHFPNPDPIERHRQSAQVVLGKDGLLVVGDHDNIGSRAVKDPFQVFRWLNLSMLTGGEDDVEGKQQKASSENTRIQIESSWIINDDWVLVAEKRGGNWNDYFFKVDNRNIIPSDEIRSLPIAISSSGKWAANDKVFKWDEDKGAYKELYEVYSRQMVFTQKEDFAYKVYDKIVSRCRLPACEKWESLNITCDKLWISPDDRWLILYHETHIEVFDTRENRIIKSIPGYARDIQFTPDSRQLLIAYRNRIDLIAIPEFQKVGTLHSDLEGINCFDLDPDARRIAIAGPRKIEIRDFSNHQLIVTLVILPNNQYLFYTPDHYYAVSKGAENNIAFQKGDAYFSFEQFDLYYNRPDIIMERLGYASPAYVQALHQAYQKRLEKFGIAETVIKPDLHLPTVRIANKEQLPFQSKSATLSLDIQAADQSYPLSRLLITVNEVPVIDLNAGDNPEFGALTYSRSFDLQFTEPQNMVEVQVWNNQGIPSLKARHVVRLEQSAINDKPDLYLAAIGVSSYQDKRMNLRYAAKDAQDVLQLFADRKGAFRRIHTFQLLDTEVTKENIRTLKARLQQARLGDRVILFVAGHGLLDDNLDFYYGTHDVDFENPANRGITFLELEGLIADLKARQKVLLMDACNSGELDKSSSVLEVVQHNTEEGTVSFRSFGAARVREKEGINNSFSMMKDLFVDLRRKSGAVIISAASGAEAAIEGGHFSNGVFTYALLEGMGAGKTTSLLADENKNGQVTISELQKYVLMRVPELTQGKQRPTSRVEYLYNDFVLWDVGGAAGTEDISWRDLDLETLKRYVARGGNINDKDRDGATLLMKAVYYSADPALARWLVRQGANPLLKGTIPLEEGGYYGNLTSIAAAQGNLEMMRFLIEECKIPVDDREYDKEDQAATGWTALQWSAENGHLPVVKYLISKGAEVNTNAMPGESPPLLLAAGAGYLEITRLLVESGARIEMSGGKFGYTALHRAARYGYLDIVKYLVQQGAPVNHQDNEGWTPSMLAGVTENYYCLEYLLKAGANTSIRNSEGKTLDDLAQEYRRPAIQELILYDKPNRPFFLAIKQKDKVAVLDFLKKGAALDVKDAFGASMFMHIVSEFEELEFIKEVATYQPDLQMRGVIWSNRVGGGFYGNLQCLAAGKGRLELLQYLLEDLNFPIDEPEYDPEDQALTGWTALQWAASQRENECIKYLIEKGANVNVGISTGDTPALLYWGATNNKAIDQWLLETLMTPENIASKTRQGWTLYHYLARSGWHSDDLNGDGYYRAAASRIYSLLKRSGQINAKTYLKGWTPLMLAAYNGYSFSVLGKLDTNKEDGADPNLVNNEGWTALMMAAEKGHESTCQYLTGWYGADCSIRNHDGETALDIARRKGYTRIVKILQDNCK